MQACSSVSLTDIGSVLDEGLIVTSLGVSVAGTLCYLEGAGIILKTKKVSEMLSVITKPANFQGFAAKGSFSLSSKEELFTVTRSYEGEFKLKGSFTGKEELALRDRFVTQAGIEMAKYWVKYEAKELKSLKKQLDKEEKRVLKSYEKWHPKEITKNMNQAQERLEQKADSLKLDWIFDSAAKDAYSGAVKRLDKEAKAALKSKKGLFYDTIIGFRNAGQSTGNAKYAAEKLIEAAMAAGAVAASGGLVIAAAAVKSALAMRKLGKQMLKLKKEYNNNYAQFSSGVTKLNKEIEAVIKLSRGMTAKHDQMMMEKKRLEDERDQLRLSIPTRADQAKYRKNIDAIEKKLIASGKELDAFPAYKPAAIEKALTDVRYQLSDHGKKMESRYWEDLDGWLGAFVNYNSVVQKSK